MNRNHLAIAAATILAFVPAIQSAAQYKAIGDDHIAAPPKLRERLNAQEAITAPSPVVNVYGYYSDAVMAAPPKLRQTWYASKIVLLGATHDTIDLAHPPPDGITASPKMREEWELNRPRFQVAAVY